MNIYTEKGKRMGRLKAIGFGTLYLVIAIVTQIVVMYELIFNMMMKRMPMKQIMDYFTGLEKNYKDNLIFVSVINLVYIAGYGTWYYFIRTRREGSPVNYRKIFSAKSILCTALMAICAQFCCNLIMIGVQVAMPEQFQNYTKLMEGLDINVMPSWAMILIVAVWAPMAEELIFRAMIFRTLRKGFGLAMAATISGVLFGVYHMNVVQGIYASAFGILLAYIYEKTNSLWGCYLYHMFFNLSSYVLGEMQEMAPVSETVLGIIVLCVSIGSVVGLVILVKVFNNMYKKETPQEVPEMPHFIVENGGGLEEENENI